jgi:malate dehydrogenase (oxaloacetate-decarboxylating)
MSLKENALKYHRKTRGKISTNIKCKVNTKKDLALAYTPGVGEVSSAIAADKSILNQVTNRGNTVAIVSDGSAVLGLGNIGPEAAMAVMEGKAVLFKKFADVDAVPICLATQDTEEIIKIVKALEPTFGGINLEDISAPRCFEIEARLRAEMNIPIFHDDQHGTAIVVLAALINALKVVNKKKEDVSIVFSGAGAAGVAIAKLLIKYGFKYILMVDSKGIICQDRTDLNESKKQLLTFTNQAHLCGTLADALNGADIFIGVSSAGIVTKEMVTTMNKKSIVFAMANPVPEIMPAEAKKGGARVTATGRSDFDNQINNVLAFPGVFRGVFDAGAKIITDEMKVAAAEAIAGLVPAKKIKYNYIIPSPFDKKVVPAVAKAVKKAIK